MTVKKPTLAEFAATKAPPPCRICVLRERDEIDEGYRTGTKRSVILEWLIETCGYPTTGLDRVTQHECDKHFKGKHHVQSMTVH